MRPAAGEPRSEIERLLSFFYFLVDFVFKLLKHTMVSNFHQKWKRDGNTTRDSLGDKISIRAIFSFAICWFSQNFHQSNFLQFVGFHKISIRKTFLQFSCFDKIGFQCKLCIHIGNSSLICEVHFIEGQTLIFTSVMAVMHCCHQVKSPLVTPVSGSRELK